MRPTPKSGATNGSKTKKKYSPDGLVQHIIGQTNAEIRARNAQKRRDAQTKGNPRSADAVEHGVNQNNPLRNAGRKIQGKPPFHDPLRDTVGTQSDANPKNKAIVAPNISGKKLAKSWVKAAANKSGKKNKGNKGDSGPGGKTRQSVGSGHKGSGSGRSSSSSSSKTSSSTTTSGAGAAPATTSADYSSRSKAAVDLMLNPKINALRGQEDTIASEYTNQKNDLNTQTGRQLSDLSTTYKQLDNSLAGLGQKNVNAYAAQEQKQGASFDQLQQALQGNAAAGQAQVGNELARLGITAGVDQSRLTGDAAYMQGQAVNNRAQAAATLQEMQANQQAFDTNTRNTSAQMGTQSQTKAKQAATDELYNLLNERNKGIAGINSQITDTEGQRGSLMQQMQDQYEQQAYERGVEAQQLGFKNQMDVNNFNLKTDQFKSDRNYKKATIAQAGQRLGLTAAQQKHQAEMDALKPGNKPVGYQGASAYLQQAAGGPGQAAALMAILQKIDTHPQNPDKPLQNFSQTRYEDVPKMLRYGYSFLDDPQFKRYNSARSRSILRQSLQAYFGKS